MHGATVGHRQGPEQSAGAFCIWTPMDLEAADVPELIEALAERFREYGIQPLESMHIAQEMLAVALSEADDVDLETVH